MLSIVVPVFDVELYLSTCLESLAGQHPADTEIIVVDDGSVDGSRPIADAWAREDPRIRILAQPNSGLSAARNTGIRAARGTYLAFCDGDDIVPPGAYAAHIASLEDSGSDFSTGDVRRIDSTGVRPHPGYQDVFARHRRRTHIRRHPALVRDRMVWNKVFRRSFWTSRHLAFALPAYEDAPVMLRAHIEAAAVDVLPEVVYHWRIREAGAPSITQRRHEPANLAACMRMVVDTFAVITELAEDLIPAYADDMCRGDIRDALDGLKLHDEHVLDEALSLARSFVVQVPADVVRALPATDRRLLDLLVRGERAEIRRLVNPVNETPQHIAADAEEPAR
ncbi:glycosyltransferase family 2 protein [Streptomyces sp. NPDC047072]|uniref:glycosyltransferase family 2 protein n=1 Tax=Streptomyces sp. NPDC047072 TaxID=3154809 RepID=UPI0033E5C6A7